MQFNGLFSQKKKIKGAEAIIYSAHMKTKALCKRTQQCWSTAPNIVGSWCVRLQAALIGIVPCFHGYNAPRRFLIKDRC